MSERVPIAIPLFVIAIGLLFVASGAIRPEFVWELGKLRSGRAWLGDAALATVLIVFGLALAAVGGILLRRR